MIKYRAILMFGISILFGGIKRGGFMVNTSILQHLPPFLGEEFAFIVSTENVQLLTSLLFHKYQPLLECSEGITFAFQKCNPYSNGYNTLTDILYIQPQSLFSISVYLYLLSDFSPFTTTPVLVPLLLHNRKRFSVLVGLKVLALLQEGRTIFLTVMVLSVYLQGPQVVKSNRSVSTPNSDKHDIKTHKLGDIQG